MSVSHITVNGIVIPCYSKTKDESIALWLYDMVQGDAPYTFGYCLEKSNATIEQLTYDECNCIEKILEQSNFETLEVVLEYLNKTSQNIETLYVYPKIVDFLKDNSENY